MFVYYLVECRPAGGLPGENGAEELLARLRHPGRHGELTRQDGRLETGYRGAGEGEAGRDKEVKQDPQRPHVHTRAGVVVILPPNTLAVNNRRKELMARVGCMLRLACH